MADIINEVEAEIKEEKSRQMLQQYAIAFAIVAVITIVGTAGWKWWVSSKVTRYEQAGDAYYNAGVLEYEQDVDSALQSYESLSESEVLTISQMSQLRRVILFIERGEHESALELFLTENTV